MTLTGYPEPPEGGPNADTRSLTRRLADICRADPARFAALVRQSDRLRAGGMPAEEAWERTLAEG